MQVCDDPDFLEEVVDCYDGVEEHEEALRDLEDVLHGACGLGLEVFDAVVADISDGTSSEGWQAQRRYVCNTVLR